ncbi:hypothetical protein STEG23_023558, partial [Scotinomys teguina]
VRHRWCELVIKHKYTKAYEQVARFLQEDQNLIQGTAQSAILSPLALGYEGSSESYTDNLEEDRKFCAISLTW